MSREDVAAAFAGLTGGEPPAGLWRAPGRVNLVGEHTDYNDGLVLPFAIDLGVDAAVRLTTSREIRLRSLQRDGVRRLTLDEVAPGRVGGWAAYVAGVAWALREEGIDVPGFDLVVDADLPAGAGLSSSAALTAVTAVALDDLLSLGLDVSRLATACRRAETEVAGAPTGVMDQIAVLGCRAGHAMLLDCRSLSVEQLPFSPAAAGLAVLVVVTGVAHDNAAGGYAERRRSCARAAELLGVGALRDASAAVVEAQLTGEPRRRARHVVAEIERVRLAADALRRAQPRELGPLLTASHVSLRDDFAVSCPELDVAVDAALDAGALGARLIGAGFGGSVVALVERASAGTVERAVTAALTGRGFTPPAVVAVAPGPPAGRLG